MNRQGNRQGNRKRHGMVRWYNPVQLLRTGIDIFVSEELNARADPRLLEVQTGPDPNFAEEGSDPVGEDGFWFDYMADTALLRTESLANFRSGSPGRRAEDRRQARS